MKRYRTIVADPPWEIEDFPPNFGYEVGKPRPYATMAVDEIKALPVRRMSDNVDGDAHLYLWVIDRFLPRAFEVAEAWGFHHMATIVWCKEPMGTGLGGIWPANVEFVLFCRRPKVTNRPDILRLTSYLADIADAKGIAKRDVNAHMGFTKIADWWLCRIEHRCQCPPAEHWPRLKAFLGLGDEMDELVAELNATKGTALPPKLMRAPGRWYCWPRGRHSEKPEAFLDLVEQVSPGPYLELFARRARFGWDYWGDESLGTAELPEAAC